MYKFVLVDILDGLNNKTENSMSQDEAIAQANALLKTAGLPTYSDLVATVEAMAVAA